MDRVQPGPVVEGQGGCVRGHVQQTGQDVCITKGIPWWVM